MPLLLHQSAKSNIGLNYKGIFCYKFTLTRMLLNVLNYSIRLVYLLFTGSMITISSAQETTPTNKLAMTQSQESSLEIASFGAGCFWCVEAVFENLDGVKKVESGYLGGQLESPTYEAVCSGTTGHAEIVQITFDPKVIEYKTLLDWLWRSHNPTTLNRQGADSGTQYRSAIFYHNEDQRMIAVASKVDAQKYFDDPIVTEITAASEFYPAENSHQDYYRLNKAAPYCQMVIRPKLEKLGL